MHTWIWFVFLAVVLIKLPLAAFMLWIPFRSDAVSQSLAASESDASGEDDGGSKTLPGDSRGRRLPRGPLHGRGPRGGPHGGSIGGDGGGGSCAPIPSPTRVRTARRRSSRVAARR